MNLEHAYQNSRGARIHSHRITSITWLQAIGKIDRHYSSYTSYFAIIILSIAITVVNFVIQARKNIFHTYIRAYPNPYKYTHVHTELQSTPNRYRCTSDANSPSAYLQARISSTRCLRDEHWCLCFTKYRCNLWARRTCGGIAEQSTRAHDLFQSLKVGRNSSNNHNDSDKNNSNYNNNK